MAIKYGFWQVLQLVVVQIPVRGTVSPSTSLHIALKSCMTLYDKSAFSINNGVVEREDLLAYTSVGNIIDQSA